MTLIADTMSSASAGWPTMTLPVTRMSVPMPWGRPGVDGISGVLVSGTVAVWVRVSVLDVAVTVTVGVLAGLVDAGLLEPQAAVSTPTEAASTMTRFMERP
jgi:hypothetical protein